MITKYDTRNIDDCVELCNETSLLVFNNTVDKDKTRQLMLYSKDLVKNSYPEFLNQLSKIHWKSFKMK